MRFSTLQRSVLGLSVTLSAGLLCGCSGDDQAKVSHGEHSHEHGEGHGEGDGEGEGHSEEGRGEHGGEHGEHRGEHGGEHGGEHEGEHRGEHARDRDGHSEEGEESGTELKLTDTYDKVRNGARLILTYDKASNSFNGTVENTTKKTLERVRVEVHLSNGRELGPTKPSDMKPGEKKEVALKAESTGFTGWSAHPEVGNEEHGHGGEHGEHDGEQGKEGRGEHGKEGRGEHGKEGPGEHGERGEHGKVKKGEKGEHS